MSPSLAGFIAWVRSAMGVTTIQLPDSSVFFTYAYNVALEIVNQTINQASSTIYTLAVYNLGGSNLVNFAQDPSGQTTFATLRKEWNILDPVQGVVQSSADVSTSQSLVVPKAMEELTIADLQYLKDPWGRTYLSFAQKYGTLWGLT